MSRPLTDPRWPQPDVAPDVAAGLALPLMEQFYTLQGEGAWAGTPAYFIRLGGCDVGCVWCDVKESWPMDAHPAVSVEEMARAAGASGAPIAVVTGGEPTLHPLVPLTEALHRAGLRTHIETSGTAPLTGAWDWVTLSPKKFRPTLPEAYVRADELKVIVYHPSDLTWATEQAALGLRPEALRLLQPEWSRRETMAPLIVAHCLAHPQWRMSLQTHKYVDIP